MKKPIILLCILCTACCGISQTPDLDTLIPRIAAEKNDSTRFYLALSGLTVSETNPVLDMRNAERILLHAQKNNDVVCEVMGLGCLGYDYRAFGNTAKSLEYNLKTNAVAERSKDPRLICLGKLLLAMSYLDLGDYPKAISYGLSSLEAADKIEVNIFTIMSNQILGEIYLKMNKVDSALVYTQKAYGLSMKSGIKDYLGAVYGQLGSIHALMQNKTLAIGYFNSALDEALKINSPKYTSLSLYTIADYYYKNKETDSALLYSKKAIAAVENTPFSTLGIYPAKLLMDIYREIDIDSAFKYSEMHRITNDSLYSIKAFQQTQLMTFEEEARQQELAVKEVKKEQQRKQNIQYALAAMGIISFVIAFLLLSRRYITNTRVIQFLGVVALLLVFEFLNLLLHPFLERITRHNAILMLLALVCIAALLVPLHHKLEKWATHKLVEKNKQLRLAAAKKTIERLEKTG